MLQIEIIGNLGADAIVKDFNGQKFISFSVAHTEKYTDAAGQKHERTTWVSCLKYGESAVLNYLKKGTLVYVRGALYTKIYEANGKPQVAVNCKVGELTLLGGSNHTEAAPAQTAAPTAAPAPAAEKKPEDDLPF